MMKQYILIMLFTLAGLAGMAQTNEPLPSGAVQFSNQLWLNPADSTIWTGDAFEGKFVNLGSWRKVDSLLALKADAADLADYYTQSQIDAFLLLKADASALDDFYNKTQIDLLLSTKADVSELDDVIREGDNVSSLTNDAGYLTSATAPVTSVNSKTGAVVINKSDIGLSNVDNTADVNKPISVPVQEALDDKEDAFAKGNIVAGTNISLTGTGSGRLVGAGDLVINANISGMQYKGTWDASTNTPTLSDATGNEGEFYRVTVAGTQNLGSGNISFTVGDDVIHDGSKWQRAPSGSAVASVNGKTGTVVLDNTDVGAPPTSRTIAINGTAGNVLVSGGTQNLSANRSWTINLSTVGTAGTYTKVTTDAYGRVTSGTTLGTGDLPSSVFQTLSAGTQAGGISISNGNAISLLSLSRDIVTSDIVTGWPSLKSIGFWPFSNTTGSTGFPSATGSGIYYNRQGVGDFSGAWMLFKSYSSSDNTLRVNFGTGANTWSGWKILATTDQIPNNFVTTNTDQTGLGGTKQWTATHTFDTRIRTNAIGSRDANFRVAFYDANSLVAGGVNMGSLLVSNAFADQTNVPTNGIWSRGDITTAGFLNSVSVNGSTQIGARNTAFTHYDTGTPGHYFYKNVFVGGTIRALGGSTTSLSDAGQIALKNTSGTPYISWHMIDGSRKGYIQATSSVFSINSEGSAFRINSLAGSGTQMIVANANGDLSRQAIPAVGVTQVNSGTHLTGGPVTSTGSLDVSFGLNSYVYDKGGNPRLYFSNNTGGNDIIMRLSQASGVWSIRDASNNQIWAINSSGSLVTGTVPWARLSGLPNLVTYNTGAYPQLEVGNSFVRTPSGGLIPAAQGGSGTIGTSTWPFGAIHGNTIYEGGTALSSKYMPTTWTLTAGDGLTGGGTGAANRTVAVDGTVVRTTRTINGKALSANITLTASDVSAMPTSWTITAGNGLTGGGNGTANRTLAVGAGDGISVASTTVGVDATVARRNAANTFSGANTFSQPVVATQYQGTAVSASSSIPTNAQSLFTATVSSNTTYTLTNMTGNPRHIQVIVTNTSGSDVFITFNGAKLPVNQSNRIEAGYTAIFTFLVNNGSAYGTKTLYQND